MIGTRRFSLDAPLRINGDRSSAIVATHGDGGRWEWGAKSVVGDGSPRTQPLILNSAWDVRDCGTGNPLPVTSI
jgi:hypothetical protein